MALAVQQGRRPRLTGASADVLALHVDRDADATRVVGRAGHVAEAEPVDQQVLVLDTSPAGAAFDTDTAEAEIENELGADIEVVAASATNVGDLNDDGFIDPVFGHHLFIESIIDPNAEIDEKYLSTVVITNDGRSITGLLVKESPEEVVIFDGKETKTIPVSEIDERAKLRQSSMPEGLAATLSPNEFLDVVTYLRQLKPAR